MKPPHIAHQLTENVKILQKCVVMHQGEVLLIQRPPDDSSRPNCWDFPGGNSEWPQGLRHNTSNLHQLDITREIREEVGLEVSPETFSLSALKYLETFYEPGREIYTVLLGWRLDLPADFDRQQIRLSHEHTTHVWVAPESARNYDFGGERGSFMLRILAGATSTTF